VLFKGVSANCPAFQIFSQRRQTPRRTMGFKMVAAKGVEAETDDGTAAADAGGGAEKPEPRRMLNEAQVLALIPISRTTLHRMTKTGRFPRGTYVSANRRLWFADQIIAWQNAVDEFNPNRGRGKGRARA
jgi:prophage regulatory protein